MLKALWLASWYPNRGEPFNGDFIQRHARAVAGFCQVHVIHIAEEKEGAEGPPMVQTADGNLSEDIYYYRHSSLPFPLGKIVSYRRYMALLEKAIDQYILREGRPHLVHVHIPMRAGLAALRLRKKYGIPFLVTEHWGIYNRQVTDHYQTRSFFFRYFSRRIMAAATALVSVSHFVGRGIQQMVVNRPYLVIPNVADEQLFNYSPAPAGKFRFIHVSNMIYLKNPEGILRAAARLSAIRSDFELVMTGHAPDSVKALAQSLHFNGADIRFTGEIPYAAVAAEVRNAHALILFSNIENSPCVIGEALCCGLPVIATRTGGIPELVNETNSLLVNPGDEDALVKAMQDMMTGYARFNRPAISSAAQAIFSYQAVGKQLFALYQQTTT